VGVTLQPYQSSFCCFGEKIWQDDAEALIQDVTYVLMKKQNGATLLSKVSLILAEPFSRSNLSAEAWLEMTNGVQSQIIHSWMVFIQIFNSQDIMK